MGPQPYCSRSSASVILLAPFRPASVAERGVFARARFALGNGSSVCLVAGSVVLSISSVSLVCCFFAGVKQTVGSSFSRPGPPIHLRFIDAVLIGVGLAFDLHEVQLILGVSTAGAQGRDSIDYVHRNGEAIDLVPNGPVERRVDVAFLFVATHLPVLVVGAAGGGRGERPG